MRQTGLLYPLTSIIFFQVQPVVVALMSPYQRQVKCIRICLENKNKLMSLLGLQQPFQDHSLCKALSCSEHIHTNSLWIAILNFNFHLLIVTNIMQELLFFLCLQQLNHHPIFLTLYRIQLKYDHFPNLDNSYCLCNELFWNTLLILIPF